MAGNGVVRQANEVYINLFLLADFFFPSVVWIEIHVVLSQGTHTPILLQQSYKGETCFNLHNQSTIFFRSSNHEKNVCPTHFIL